MKTPALPHLVLLLLLLFISGCGGADPVTPISTPTVKPTSTPVSQANADVRFVQAVEEDDGSWTFHVRVAHPDTGWEDYADGWDVVLPDGTVLLPDPDSPFTRLLVHPHENEQPFTRSQSGIEIPEGIDTVTVRAHDLVDGFGGQEVVVHLDQAAGLNFEVERQNVEETSTTYLGLTNQNEDGNRYVLGQIDLQNAAPLDIYLAGEPDWVVGVPAEQGVVWVVALADGRLQGFLVVDGDYSAVNLSFDALPAGMPPAISYDGEDLQLLNALSPDSSPLTHPVLTPAGEVATIDEAGEMMIGSDSLSSDALPDARILQADGALLFFSGPTNKYDHGVLGDKLEASTITLVDTDGQLKTISVENAVIEGIAPIWADLDGDGEREILVTVSSQANGAQLVVYDQDGKLLAQGDAIGTGYRWRHQIAAAPFGPNGELEIVDVLTPHLGGIVEFFRWEDDQLVKTAEVPGYTSHEIYTRNLDMAFAADVDADGKVELLLPNQQRTTLAVIDRTADGAQAAFEIPLDGTLVTNLGTVSLPLGELAVAAGVQHGVLRVWMP